MTPSTFSIGDVVGFVEPEPAIDIAPWQDCRWYILQTEPSREFTVTANLTLRRVPFYVPTHVRPAHVNRYRAGQAKPDVHRPLFPGMVFIADNVAEAKDRAIRVSYGVAARPYLHFGEHRAVMDAGQMAIVQGIEALLRDRYEARRRRETNGKVEIRHFVGDAVRVHVEELLGGEVGVIDDIDERGRITVLMNIMKRKVRVRMTQDQVDPV
jgi:transcriptional antiterminator RfaH